MVDSVMEVGRVQFPATMQGAGVGAVGGKLAQGWGWALWVWGLVEGVMGTIQDRTVRQCLLHRRWVALGPS